ncbi:hypothetical protein BJV77DRAFT_1066603 [Russula vinacea]|nr:hypothetical protein BJV77DRAFT_1066603 [Russula vinacea]
MIVPTLILPRDDELEILGRTVEETLGRSVQSIDVIGRDPLSRASLFYRAATFAVAMKDGNHLIARVADSHMPTRIMESEIATMQWVRERTSIPVPKILTYELDQSHPLGAHMFLEKARSNPDPALFDLPAESQDSLVTQLAQFMVELSHLSFPAIGSIALPPQPCDPPSSALPPLGPLTHPCFYVEAAPRSRSTAAHSPQRAHTSSLGAPAGAEYQALLAETQAIVERAVTLLIELVRRCEGLDSADPELARYALDLHELGLKNIIVAPDDPTRILALVDWQSASVRPLWRCDDDACKQRLRSVFRAAVANDPVFSRAVDADDTRHALDEVAEYDAFRDGFLVLPTLQSILATLPGEEGVDGLLKLSDPQILAGRIACISLLTTGSGLLSLAASTPGSPLGDSPITFGWNRKLYRYSVPATPRYSVPPTPIS